MANALSAWSIRRYGAPEQLAPVTRTMPSPGPSEVLIQIHASAVTRADGMIRSGTPRWARLFLGFRRPRKDLSGTGLSGVVIATGNEVSRFSIGDEVFGETGLNFGANASHICLSESGVLMPKPEALSHEEAAVMCDGPLTSFNFLHVLADLRPQEKVLIIGASGSLGSAAVQIAAAMGAEVTGTCSARNSELVASLGAAHVIDYEVEDITQSAQRYDVIYDTLGLTSFAQAKRVLSHNGRYVCPVLGVSLLMAVLCTAMFGSRKAKFSATGILEPAVLRDMLGKLLELVERDELSPVMDRTYPLEDLIEAHRYMETGHKRGNVVVA